MNQAQRTPQDVEFAKELIAAACAAMGIEIKDAKNPRSNMHQGAFYKLRRLAWWLANGRGRNDGASLRAIAVATDYSYAPVKRGVELLAKFPGPAHPAVQRLVVAFRAAVDGRPFTPLTLTECVEAFDVLEACAGAPPAGSALTPPAPPHALPVETELPMTIVADDEPVLNEWRAMLARLRARGVTRSVTDLVDTIRRNVACSTA